MFDIKQIVLFKEMLSDRFVGETFRILWPLDLELSSSSQKIKLLLHNERNGFYLVGSVAPEYLFYCTIGSRFKEGKKLEGPGLGNVFSCRVASQDRNTVLLASNAITEDEYSLSHSYQTKNPDGSPRLVDYGKYCKHQRCLVFNDDVDKIVIPCAVIAATYYFTSISMREQVFAQNLRGLYALANVDPVTREATILMKPGAGDDDIARIARFAIDPHAEKCWDAIMNLIRRDQWIGKNGIKHCPITADIPVVQDLDLKVRGIRTTNNRGGKTTIVFEILEENSRYPFERLRPQRHSPGSRTGEEQLFSPSLAKADPKPIVVNTPSSGKYKPVIIRRPAGAANPWEQSLIVEQTEILSTHEQHQELCSNTPIEHGSQEEVDLSPQKQGGGWRKTAKVSASISREKQDTIFQQECEQVLQNFIGMMDVLSSQPGVTEIVVSGKLNVWRKERGIGKKLSLRESYDGTSENRRKYITVTFEYRGRYVCLVEISQAGLSSRYGTFVVSSDKTFAGTEAKELTEMFVKSVNVKDMVKSFMKSGFTLKTKSHPISYSNEIIINWCKLLLAGGNNN